MSIAINRMAFTDVEALQDIIQGGQSEVIQLGTGRMQGSMSHMAFDKTFSVSTGEFSIGMRADGVISDTSWSFGILLETSAPVSGHHAELKAGEFGIAAPGTVRYSAFKDRTRYAAAVIAPQAIERFLHPQPGAYDALLQHKLSVLHTSPEHARHNIATLKPILHALTEHGAKMTADVIAFHKRNIMELVTTPFRDKIHYGQHYPIPSRLVLEVDRYLIAAGDRPVHISELCEHFHVHRRTLHRAFHEVMGIGPINFMRRLRLNNIHAEMLRAKPGTKVADIARAHGFIELGRFAAAYRRMFGELPSHTLRRGIGTIVTLIFFFFITACMDFDYKDCDQDDYFIAPRPSRVLLA